jgi:hypothetical protein
MPRNTRCRRELDGRITVIIDGVRHTLTEPAFIELMGEMLPVLQVIAARTLKPKSMQ